MTSAPERPRGHSHVHSGTSRAAASPLVGRVILLGLLGLVAVATVAGLLLLWPSGDKVAALQASTTYAVPGATFESAVVVTLTDGCGSQDQVQASNATAMSACQTAEVRILTGPKAGQSTEVHLSGPSAVSGITVGDRIQLFIVPTQGTAPAGRPGAVPTGRSSPTSASTAACRSSSSRSCSS